MSEDRLAAVDTILFDLDGTLLSHDVVIFMGRYLEAITRRVAGLVDPVAFVRRLMISTKDMVENTDPGRTNAEVFAAGFYPAIGLDRQVVEGLFQRFYAEDFPALRAHTSPRPAARLVLETAAARGYGLVLATNPVFPRVATEERMRWAGVDGYPWRLVTTYEDMHACKPHLAYYEEILATIGRRAEQCLMVGNDVEEDVVAGRLGMVTFLDRTHLIHRGSGPTGADFEGDLDALDRLLRTLPGPAAARARIAP
jgi:FMN phosphatase YigB (HAD superfamily)